MVLGLTAAAAQAQMTPVGLWKSVDDKSGEAKSEIRVAENDGVVTGRIEQILRKGADPAATCTECSDDRKGQPLKGLEIIRGARASADGTVWEGGKILDPENGKSYTLRLTPADEGRKLDVRGSIGPFGRTQTWQRVP